MNRTILLAGRTLLATIALASPAFAALGGGEARMTGSGDAVSIERLGPAPRQAGRRTLFAGSSGDGPEVQTLEEGPAAQPGREVILQGGGDDATLLVIQPRG